MKISRQGAAHQVRETLLKKENGLCEESYNNNFQVKISTSGGEKPGVYPGRRASEAPWVFVLQGELVIGNHWPAAILFPQRQ